MTTLIHVKTQNVWRKNTHKMQFKARQERRFGKIRRTTQDAHVEGYIVKTRECTLKVASQVLDGKRHGVKRTWRKEPGLRAVCILPSASTSLGYCPP